MQTSRKLFQKISFCDAFIPTILSIYISQGSVETHLMCGEIFNNNFIANCPQSVPAKKFWKSVNIW